MRVCLEAKPPKPREALSTPEGGGYYRMYGRPTNLIQIVCFVLPPQFSTLLLLHDDISPFFSCVYTRRR